MHAIERYSLSSWWCDGVLNTTHPYLNIIISYSNVLMHGTHNRSFEPLRPRFKLQQTTRLDSCQSTVMHETQAAPVLPLSSLVKGRWWWPCNHTMTSTVSTIFQACYVKHLVLLLFEHTARFNTHTWKLSILGHYSLLRVNDRVSHARKSIKLLTARVCCESGNDHMTWKTLCHARLYPEQHSITPSCGGSDKFQILSTPLPPSHSLISPSLPALASALVSDSITSSYYIL